MSGLNLGSKPENETKEETKTEAPKVSDAEVAESEVDGILERWSSHPIMRYNVAEFQFENGLLELRTEAQVAEFKEIREQLPQSEQVRIKKLDIDAARQMAADWIASQGGATKEIDSSTGERATGSLVGTGELAQQ